MLSIGTNPKCKYGFWNICTAKRRILKHFHENAWHRNKSKMQVWILEYMRRKASDFKAFFAKMLGIGIKNAPQSVGFFNRRYNDE